MLQAKTIREIEKLKEGEKLHGEWLEKVSSILNPLTDEVLNRGNAMQLIGRIDEMLSLKKDDRMGKL